MRDILHALQSILFYKERDIYPETNVNTSTACTKGNLILYDRGEKHQPFFRYLIVHLSKCAIKLLLKCDSCDAYTTFLDKFSSKAKLNIGDKQIAKCNTMVYSTILGEG